MAEFLDANGLNIYHQGVKELIDSAGGDFVITIAKDGSTHTCDKTNSEVREAYSSGKSLVVKYVLSNNRIYYLPLVFHQELTAYDTLRFMGLSETAQNQEHRGALMNYYYTITLTCSKTAGTSTPALSVTQNQNTSADNAYTAYRINVGWDSTVNKHYLTDTGSTLSPLSFIHYYQYTLNPLAFVLDWSETDYNVDPPVSSGLPEHTSTVTCPIKFVSIENNEDLGTRSLAVYIDWRSPDGTQTKEYRFVVDDVDNDDIIYEDTSYNPGGGLPAVTSADEGKALVVDENGEWVAGEVATAEPKVFHATCITGKSYTTKYVNTFTESPGPTEQDFLDGAILEVKFTTAHTGTTANPFTLNVTTSDNVTLLYQLRMAEAVSSGFSSIVSNIAYRVKLMLWDYDSFPSLGWYVVGIPGHNQEIRYRGHSAVSSVPVYGAQLDLRQAFPTYTGIAQRDKYLHVSSSNVLEWSSVLPSPDQATSGEVLMVDWDNSSKWKQLYNSVWYTYNGTFQMEFSQLLTDGYSLLCFSAGESQTLFVPLGDDSIFKDVESDYRVHFQSIGTPLTMTWHNENVCPSSYVAGYFAMYLVQYYLSSAGARVWVNDINSTDTSNYRFSGSSTCITPPRCSSLESEYQAPITIDSIGKVNTYINVSGTNKYITGLTFKISFYVEQNWSESLHTTSISFSLLNIESTGGDVSLTEVMNNAIVYVGIPISPWAEHNVDEGGEPQVFNAYWDEQS